MTGVERIATERKRQIESEGWSAEHDDSHDHGELARAAACYALNGDNQTATVGKNAVVIDLIKLIWPWDWKWWTPSPVNRIRELEKAGALIAAEIDRLLRQGDL
ncbi:MAG: hypothetical protein LBH43_11230 [Treponema sp.]|jgi:hypothetical protein|nr:hypothetical protein [Treponema sp.]